MMKLSALLTGIIVLAFATVTTSAKPQCTITLDNNSGCGAEDIAEIVSMLNMKFQQEWSGTRNRDLKKDEEISSTGLRLRGAHPQDQRELPVCPPSYTYCYPNDPRYPGSYVCAVCFNMRRDLQSLNGKSTAAEFGRMIMSIVGTFEWDECKPSIISKMGCTDV